MPQDPTELMRMRARALKLKQQQQRGFGDDLVDVGRGAGSLVADTLRFGKDAVVTTGKAMAETARNPLENVRQLGETISAVPDFVSAVPGLFSADTAKAIGREFIGPEDESTAFKVGRGAAGAAELLFGPGLIKKAVRGSRGAIRGLRGVDKAAEAQRAASAQREAADIVRAGRQALTPDPPRAQATRVAGTPRQPSHATLDAVGRFQKGQADELASRAARAEADDIVRRGREMITVDTKPKVAPKPTPSVPEEPVRVATPTARQVVGAPEARPVSAGTRRGLTDQRRLKGAEEVAAQTGIPEGEIRAITGGPSRVPLETELRFLDRAYERALQQEGLTRVIRPHTRGVAQALDRVTPSQRARFLDVLEEMGDQSGRLSLQASPMVAGAAAGGALGALAGDDLEEAVYGGLGGMLVGAGLGFGAQQGARLFGTQAGRTAFLQTESANMLAGPAAVKASLGASSAAVIGLAEAAIAKGNVRAAKAMLSYLLREAPGDYMRGLAGRGLRDISPHHGPTNKALEIVLRPFKAADTVTANAFARGRAAGYNIPTGEAANLMLTGSPTSEFGQQAIKLMQRNFATQLFFKFPTVVVQGAERGIEFSPLGLLPAARRHLRNAQGALQLSESQRLFRAGTGTALTGVGFGIGATTDPGFKTSAVLASAAGPASVPAGIGIAAGRGFRAGGLESVIDEVIGEMAFTVPTITEGSLSRFKFIENGRLVIPKRWRPFFAR